MEKELTVYLHLKFPCEGNLFEFLSYFKDFCKKSDDFGEIQFDFSSITSVSDYKW